MCACRYFCVCSCAVGSCVCVCVCVCVCMHVCASVCVCVTSSKWRHKSHQVSEGAHPNRHQLGGWHIFLLLGNFPTRTGPTLGACRGNMASPHASCIDCCIRHSNGTCAGPDLVGGMVVVVALAIAASRSNFP